MKPIEWKLYRGGSVRFYNANLAAGGCAQVYYEPAEFRAYEWRVFIVAGRLLAQGRTHGLATAKRRAAKVAAALRGEPDHD